MHVMGKVGVWLVVIAAAASTVLTSKLIQVRNSWTKKASTYQTQYQALLPKIAALNEQVARLEADRIRAAQLYGRYWKDVPTQVMKADEGVLVIGIGANNGIREKQVLYGFETLPNGTTVYRGDFTVVTARDVQAQVQPNWKVRADDVQTWQPNANWRWRDMIPPGDQPVFDQQILAIAKTDDVLVDRKKKLATETNLEMHATAQLKLREAELVGGDQLSKDPAVDVEFREGLVAAVEQVEESRNQVLRKVDELRRRLRVVQQGVDHQTAENLELTGKLPQPATSVGSTKN
jgi:hypothetical protein